jgi:hypothetical protein
MNDNALKLWGGPASSFFPMALCAIFISVRPDNPVWGMVWWLAFVLIASLFVNPRDYDSRPQLAKYCLIPATVLVGAWLATFWIRITWGGGQPHWNTVLSAAMLAPLMFAATWAGTLAGALGRDQLMQMIMADEALSKANRRLKAIAAFATTAVSLIGAIIGYLLS